MNNRFKFLSIATFIMAVSLVLAACGASATPIAANDAAQVSSDVKQPREEGIVVEFRYMSDSDPAIEGDQPNVSLQSSKFDPNDPNFVPPHFQIKGEGINLNFTWEFITIYKPELVGVFQNLRDYDLKATIDGKPYFVQLIKQEGDLIRVEFESYDSLTPAPFNP